MSCLWGCTHFIFPSIFLEETGRNPILQKMETKEDNLLSACSCFPGFNMRPTLPPWVSVALTVNLLDACVAQPPKGLVNYTSQISISFRSRYDSLQRSSLPQQRHPRNSAWRMIFKAAQVLTSEEKRLVQCTRLRLLFPNFSIWNFLITKIHAHTHSHTQTCRY